MKSTDLDPYLNSQVDLDPAPIAAGGLLTTWMVKSCDDSRVVLETKDNSGGLVQLWLRPREVLRPVTQSADSARPVWKLNSQLYYNGRRFVGSSDAE